MNDLVMDNLKLVDFCVCKINTNMPANGIEYDDLIQIGRMALIKAAEKFDPLMGYEFSTYAFAYIKGEVRHYIRDKGGLIRVSRGHQPIYVDSLDRQPTGYESPITLIDTIPCDRSNHIIDEDLRQAIESLPTLDRDILTLTQLDNLTHKQAARQLGIAPATVSRHLKTAIERVRLILTEGSNYQFPPITTRAIQADPAIIESLRQQTSILDPNVENDKSWSFISQNNIVYTTNNLSLFARIHGLRRPSLAKVWQGKNKTHAGWRKYDTIDGTAI